MVRDRAGRGVDRGLAYGDGLFETVLFVHGHAPLWSRHMARLPHGCARLALPPPDPAVLAAEAASVCAGLTRAVVRIIVTRGSGPRGYAPPADTQPTRIVAAFPAPAPAADGYAHGIRVRCCETRLAEQPRWPASSTSTASNRCWRAPNGTMPAIDEGLLRDAGERLVCGDRRQPVRAARRPLVTPRPAPLRRRRRGARRNAARSGPTATLRDLSLDELIDADEIFLTSSCARYPAGARAGCAALAASAR